MGTPSYHGAVGDRAAWLLERSGVRPSAGVSAEALQEIARHVAKQSMSSENGGPMTTTLNKRSDVLAAHAGQVVELYKHHPDKGEAELRRMAWETRPDLRQRWEELPAEGRPAAAVSQGQAQPVQKGTDVLQKHAAAVGQLRALHPDKGDGELRRLAWETRPDLRAEYNAAMGSPF